MTLPELLLKHGLQHRDLALISGRTTRAVSHWTHGIRPPPRSLELLLQALDEGRIDQAWLAQKLAPKIRKANK